MQRVEKALSEPELECGPGTSLETRVVQKRCQDVQNLRRENRAQR